MSSVAVIDYGMGNLHSIAKALQHAHSKTAVIVTDNPETILKADRVVFPGVGAIRDCMNALADRDLVTIIERAAASKPLLGICLGMQALLEESEENGGTACLGLIPGRVVRFADGVADAAGQPLKIPHMGWNRVSQQEADHPLWRGIASDSWFYFVHSYFARPTDSRNVAATTDYSEPFASALARENIFAVQFHPEKSQEAGLRLLANFLNWDPGR
ncbi:imidazole glycerol phosphate synthase subunit HisH [Methylocaldum sp. RMAD-M]|jgi:glutamine amidotransferase|uniref:imidazole glycerol phosphate synthase subunit HisH n=1 Tax=unclassified Methylocaldum TaxID=2622260 RepID=UPI001AE8CD3F|nr:imidazole glycerol phosphate synthase subunit HisH [Methylocaldum sp. RMAD-M]MBP1148413.1 glutamine amidotransferase [Methylocaldum sp. RMAD-M]